jgi:truncated hemoglobin YjbI
MYPEDLEPGKHHLALFLAQYWGGGAVYGLERGHPGCACGTRPSRSPRRPRCAGPS